jgi:hypothetical protein
MAASMEQKWIVETEQMTVGLKVDLMGTLKVDLSVASMDIVKVALLDILQVDWMV